MHVSPPQARHRLPKLTYAGMDLLVFKADVCPASATGQLRMIAKISNGLAMARAAVATDDFYHYGIQGICSHLVACSDSRLRL